MLRRLLPRCLVAVAAVVMAVVLSAYPPQANGQAQKKITDKNTPAVVKDTKTTPPKKEQEKKIAPKKEEAKKNVGKNIIVKKIDIKEEKVDGQARARLIVYFDQASPYQVLTMANPARFVVNVAGDVAARGVKLPDNPWVKNYRVNNGVAESQGESRGQLVLDLKKNVTVKSATHHDGGKDNFSIVTVMADSQTMAAFNRQSQSWQGGDKPSDKASDKAIAAQEPKQAASPPTRQANNQADKKSVKQGAKKNENDKKDSSPSMPKPVPLDAIGSLIAQAEQERPSPALRSQLDDLIKKSDNLPAPKNAKQQTTQNQAANKTQPEKETPKDKPLIAIDAGHGGIDTGAIGRRGTREKLINMAVARQMAGALEQTGRYRVVLTRTGDYFIPLRERYRIAERAKADFFISIHADSFPDPNVLGASIYTLSNVASDRETAKIAERENNSDKYASMFERGLPFDARVILLGLGQKQKDAHSNMFAELVAKKLPPTVPFLKNQPHRFASFTVMKSITMPSVLLEMGFLSSEQQEKQIISPEFRNNLTYCMVKAFDQYFYSITMARGCQ